MPAAYVFSGLDPNVMHEPSSVIRRHLSGPTATTESISPLFLFRTAALEVCMMRRWPLGLLSSGVYQDVLHGKLGSASSVH